MARRLISWFLVIVDSLFVLVVCLGGLGCVKNCDCLFVRLCFKMLDCAKNCEEVTELMGDLLKMPNKGWTRFD